MAASVSTINQHVVDSFRRGIIMLSQQKGSKLEAHVEIENMIGEFAFVNRIDQTDVVDDDTRHGDTPLIEMAHSRRRISAAPKIWATLLDKADKVRLLEDPTNKYSQSAVMAMGRDKDSVLITAATGNAFSGKRGDTTVALPSGQKVAVDLGGASEGMTVEKLIEASSIYGINDVDEDEEKFLVCSQKQIDNLLALTKVTNSDFNTVQALVQGKINQYMGFTFKRTQLTALNASTDVRTCFTFTKSALVLGVNMGVEATIDRLPTKKNAIQVLYQADHGATRLEDEKVVQILCDESP